MESNGHPYINLLKILQEYSSSLFFGSFICRSFDWHVDHFDQHVHHFDGHVHCFDRHILQFDQHMHHHVSASF